MFSTTLHLTNLCAEQRAGMASVGDAKAEAFEAALGRLFVQVVGAGRALGAGAARGQWLMVGGESYRFID